VQGAAATAWATWAISALTVLSWLIVWALGIESLAAVYGGFIPARAFDATDVDLIPFLLTPLTATLIHGGLLHLAMNVMILFYCGERVEKVLGPGPMILIYLVGAYASTGLHFLVNMDQMMPMVGASGAVSAVIGAYSMVFSTSETKSIGPVSAYWVRALWLAAGWAFVQWLFGLATAAEDVQIAIAAHIGGFLAGVLMIRPLFRHRFGND
jgi:membrane associated rhomboid family serine protease